MSDRSICHQLFEAFLIGGACAVVGFTTAYLIDKINQHDNENKELFSQDNEFKK